MSLILSAVHPVSCSLLWVRCLKLWAIFDFRFWGQMTPKVKIFETVFPDSATAHRNTFRDQICWKSTVAKLPKGRLVYHTKNSRSAGLVPAPILPKMDRSRLKFPERCQPLTWTCIPNLVRVGCVLRTYSGKIDFSAKKKSIQYIGLGFQQFSLQ